MILQKRNLFLVSQYSDNFFTTKITFLCSSDESVFQHLVRNVMSLNKVLVEVSLHSKLGRTQVALEDIF